MYRREEGFSLIELMVALSVFIVAIAASSNIFLTLLGQYKQQSKITEGGMEGIVGFGILKNDVLHAGDGLPWIITGGYASESVGAQYSVYNDTGTVPRAVVSGDGDGAGIASSDILVVRALNLGSNDASQKWTLMSGAGTTRTWSYGEDLVATDRVIVVDPGGTDGSQRELLGMTTFSGASAFASTSETYIVYGVDDSAVRMPFNRADYSLSTVGVPVQCAGGTGVLVKGEVSHADGSVSELPLVDCVADLQFVYGLDTDDNGTIDRYLDDIDIPMYDAATIRAQLKEIRIYVLSHEGQRDTRFNFDADPGTSGVQSSITVGETLLTVSHGRTVSLPAVTSNWSDYRWKTHTLVIKTESLNLV
jgi:prepilin-type N-terminal cleavage/methylation domain-containing protein